MPPATGRPYNAFFHVTMAMEANSPDEALVSVQRALALQPESLWAHQAAWNVFQQKEEYARAVAEAKEVYRLLGAPDVVEALDRGYAKGKYEDAMRQAADALVQRSKRTSVRPTDIARMYARVGEKDLALDWLEKAYQERSGILIYLNVSRFFASLQSDPRFQQIIRRMNFPQ